MNEPKEMSAELRALLAGVLCLVVLFGWSLIYKPPKPALSPVATQPAPEVATPQAPPTSAAVAAPEAKKPVVPTRAAKAEQTIVVESDLYRVELSNQGAVVRSWQLKKYEDENVPPRTLDLVNPDAAEQLKSWPFSLALDNAQLEAQANTALYEVTTSPSTGTQLRAPAEITFSWSDGHLEVSKRLKFGVGYMVDVETSVRLDGKPLASSLSWRGGFGDATVVSRRGLVPPQVFFSRDGKIDTLVAKKLGQPTQPTQRITQLGPYDFVGIEDMYFTAAFLPPLGASGQLPPANLTLTDWAPEREIHQPDGKVTKDSVPEMGAGSLVPGPLAVRIYVGPKGIDGLKSVKPPLNGLVQFGWLTVIAEPLFYGLLWLHKFFPNYGWDIVLLTIAINMVMFPLKLKQMRAAQKMQRVGPEIKALQEKYKKYSMRDPRKAEMNKEMMAIYSREGINPLGSCWPMLVQLPIWYAFYRTLEYTIELRHAPWILWVHDLSVPDPTYVLPILLGITMFAVTKMTPTPGVDPAQARMMTIMPLMFGFFFIFYPSGLSLYILASNVVGIGQQLYLNRTMPPPAPVKNWHGPGGKKK